MYFWNLVLTSTGSFDPPVATFLSDERFLDSISGHWSIKATFLGAKNVPVTLYFSIRPRARAASKVSLIMRRVQPDIPEL